MSFGLHCLRCLLMLADARVAARPRMMRGRAVCVGRGTHNSGVVGRGDGREKGPMQATSGPQRDKTRPAARLGGPPGTKLSQRAALAGPPGTKLSQQAPKRRFWPTFRMQGELCTASATNTTSREKKVTHQHPTAPQQRAPPQISHAIRLNELSTKPRNVAIPTT